MPDAVSHAVDIARIAVGADARTPGTATWIRRLDLAPDYVIVNLGRGGPGWIAAVEPVTGEVLSHAENPSGASTLPPMGAEQGEYVWAPSEASRSPLYPLLLVSTSSYTHLRDLTGRIHPYPAPATRG